MSENKKIGNIIIPNDKIDKEGRIKVEDLQKGDTLYSLYQESLLKSTQEQKVKNEIRDRYRAWLNADDNFHKVLQKIVELKTTEEVENDFSQEELFCIVQLLRKSGDRIIYEDSGFEYVCYEHIPFKVSQGIVSLVSLPKEEDFEQILNDCSRVKQLKHIVQSLTTDLNSGILQHRMQEIPFLSLKKELLLFNHPESPMEYHYPYFISEESVKTQSGAETTNDLFKRFSLYSGLTALR